MSAGLGVWESEWEGVVGALGIRWYSRVRGWAQATRAGGPLPVWPPGSPKPVLELGRFLRGETVGSQPVGLPLPEGPQRKSWAFELLA